MIKIKIDDPDNSAIYNYLYELYQYKENDYEGSASWSDDYPHYLFVFLDFDNDKSIYISKDIYSAILKVKDEIAKSFNMTTKGAELYDRITINKLKKSLSEKQRAKRLKKIAQMELEQEGILFQQAHKRPPVPKDVADFVYRRDGGKCVYCGSTENLQFDHIIPFSKGGATTAENLQILCKNCNLKKSNNIG